MVLSHTVHLPLGALLSPCTMCGAGKDMGPKKPMLLSPDTFAEEAGKAKFTVPADASVLAELYREAVLHGFGEGRPWDAQPHTRLPTPWPCCTGLVR